MRLIDPIPETTEGFLRWAFRWPVWVAMPAYHPWWLGRVPLYAGMDWPLEIMDWTD